MFEIHGCCACIRYSMRIRYRSTTVRIKHHLWLLLWVISFALRGSLLLFLIVPCLLGQSPSLISWWMMNPSALQVCAHRVQHGGGTKWREHLILDDRHHFGAGCRRNKTALCMNGVSLLCETHYVIVVCTHRVIYCSAAQRIRLQLCKCIYLGTQEWCTAK